MQLSQQNVGQQNTFICFWLDCITIYPHEKISGTNHVFFLFCQTGQPTSLTTGFHKNENKSWERSQHLPAQLSLQLPTADPIMSLFLSHIYFFTRLITRQGQRNIPPIIV